MKNFTRTVVISATPYKGFTVQEADDGRFYIVGLGQWRVDGYGSMNTAKGAITKHLKAIVIPFDFTATEDRIAELFKQVRDSGMTILAPY